MKREAFHVKRKIRETKMGQAVKNEKIGKIFGIGFLVLILFTLHTSRGTLHAETGPFDAIKATYSQINTLTARFHQKIRISSLGKEREFDGSFFYKRQKGFLWQYASPKGKYFLYDGKYIWQGEDEKPFVTKDKVNKEKTGGTFLDLVEDFSKLDELFALQGQGKSGDMEILELLPKKDSTIKSAKVWIDRQNIVKKIELQEFTGNINIIEFSSIKVNQSIEDKIFVFKPEKGKEIIER
jgi:outer membrane lipoprotein carrier protein